LRRNIGEMTENTENSNPYKTVGVVGAGAWGTALALVAAQAGRTVTLWARERFLPGVELPPAILGTRNIEAMGDCDAILIVVPAQHLREVLPAMPPAKPLVICAKGIEKTTGKLLPEVLADAAPNAVPAILSGPSFARDVSLGLPTAVTIAARMDVALRLQATLGHATFRPYASDDLTGVALGGAAKNVYAIACGIVDGMGLGESARAALIARSFAELTRLGQALGARADTLMGLSGLGDLVLTATSTTSRNFSYGRALGQGTAPEGALAEGVETAPALVKRARAERVELPIAEAVAHVLDGSLSVGQAVLRLMSRPLKPE
jgi:glycerol-3-phosphate dehydrogenase (NAD(P)+)